MNRDTLRQMIVGLATLATIVINVLANALPFNGQNTGAISDRFLVYFVPAGYVFAIWGVIYIGLIAFVIYQALPAQRQNAALRRIGWWVVLADVANSAWIFLWHYNIFPATVVAMLALLISLIAVYLGLGIGRARVSTAERWMTHVPFSIYLGWITVATVANVTAVLYLLIAGAPQALAVTDVRLLGIGPEAWTVIMLVVGAALATAMSFTRRDVAYALVIAWAFVGIAVKWPAVPLVAGAAWAMAAVALVGMVVALVRKPKGALGK